MDSRPGTAFPLEVTPRLPAELQRLAELANNLWFSWNGPARELFSRLDPVLWAAVGQNPKAMLRTLSDRRLEDAAHDPAFLHEFYRALGAFEANMAQHTKAEAAVQA